MNRRTFLKSSVLAAVSTSIAKEPTHLHIASSTYPWGTFAKRSNRDFVQHTNELFTDISSTGMTGYEPNIRSLAEFNGLAERLEEHRLEMRSVYVNTPNSPDSYLSCAF